MQKVILATANADKANELRAILSGTPVEIVTPGDLGGMPETEENAASYAGNALLKACAARDYFGLPAAADDSGLEVEELEGAPGVYSARYAGPDCSYEDNNRQLLHEMEAILPRDRLAQFICVAALALPNGKEYVFTGLLPGNIAEEPRGKNGFGYDPVFIPDGGERTFAEMTPKEKNKISHRYRAFKHLAAGLKKLYG